MASIPDDILTTQEMADAVKRSYQHTRKLLAQWGFKPVKTIGRNNFYSSDQRDRLRVLMKGE